MRRAAGRHAGGDRGGRALVGRPRFRDPAEDERPALDAARAILAAVPPFPGGDAGHFHPDYEKLFRLGVRGLLDEIAAWKRATDGDANARFSTTPAASRWRAVRFIHRVADAAPRWPSRIDGESGSLAEMAAICRRVATEPPPTFHEAIQLMFLTLVALWFGEDHGLTTPGRLDQTLRPFYEADLAAGRITPQAAFELICCLYIQLNRILCPGLAMSVMVGGRDAAGDDVTNDLTYLCLAARLATRLVYPTVGLCWHQGTPAGADGFRLQMLANGGGDPAFFNDELIVAGPARPRRGPGGRPQLHELDLRRDQGGRRVEHLGHRALLQLPQGLLDVHGRRSRPAREPRRRRSRSSQALRAREPGRQGIAAAAADLDRVWRSARARGCFPLASCLIDDCLERGLDFDRGGARYNWVENSFVGLANLVDSLVAVAPPGLSRSAADAARICARSCRRLSRATRRCASAS